MRNIVLFYKYHEWTAGYQGSEMSDTCAKLRLCSVDDVARDSVIRVEAGELTLAVFKVSGVFYVTDDQCTHGPGSLSDGYLDEFEIECNFHNGRFDIRTGEVVAPPCMIPLRTYKVFIENDDVLVESLGEPCSTKTAS